MRLRGKQVGNLGFDDIQALVDNRVGESITLDYKLELHVSKNDEKKDFLADVTAFANTAGGVILYGISEAKNAAGEKEGYPDKIVGIEGGYDEIARRLEAIIADSIQPRLGGVALQKIDLPGTNRYVLVLGIPRSLVAPHAVWFEKSGKFYLRSNSGKYQSDVQELRRMFLEANEWEKDAEHYRLERTDRVRAGEVLTNLKTDGAVFLHVLPLGRLREFQDVISHQSTLQMSIRPVRAHSWSYRPNLDGYLIYTSDRDTKLCYSYVQWLRCGGVECYTSKFNESHYQTGTPILNAPAINKFVIENTEQAVGIMERTFLLTPPYVVFLSIFDVKGLPIYCNSYGIFGSSPEVIDQRNLILPPIIINSSETNIAAAVQPLLDMVWQSAGFDKAQAIKAE